ncbi:MAG: A/G-specific adenine glycosylase [Hydrogenophilaceae bacterium]|nr:A/G-specific adenine glycosylase [Hydrogenophilaceae bacterium]
MTFAEKLIEWHKKHGRHDLPWQGTRDPYAIWVSEIMLQQTQVATVVPYYNRFMARFADIPSLASASEDEVLAHWAGLGYYARGRNLHRAARQIMELHAGIFPRDLDLVNALPGIGRSTAAAIAVFAYGTRAPILDGNVKRVLSRVFAVEGWPGIRDIESRLWKLAASLLPGENVEAYTQAQMDLGATVCMRTRPDCKRCPLAPDCIARRENRTGELPTARPRRMLPQRSTTLLLLRHGQNVLLEKRPSTGIWGGLWSLPETSADPESACLQLTGHSPESMQRLPALTHVFTHFKLDIKPVLIAVGGTDIVAREPVKVWMGIDEAARAAIPKPVRTILESLC